MFLCRHAQCHKNVRNYVKIKMAVVNAIFKAYLIKIKYRHPQFCKKKDSCMSVRYTRSLMMPNCDPWGRFFLSEPHINVRLLKERATHLGISNLP